jgi:hypothetical protein
MTDRATGFDDYGIYQGTQVIYDLPAHTYHTDPDGPRLSQSLATTCVLQTPLHAWQKHPLLGNVGYQYEPSDDDGTIIHSLVLEPDSDAIEEIDGSQIKTKGGEPAKLPFSTTEGKQLRDAALAAGKIPLLSEKLGVFRYKAKAIRQRLESQGVAFSGQSEVTIYWSENTPSGVVRCRARLDHLIVTPGRIKIIDLKSTENAHPQNLRATAWRYGYDIQQAAYRRAVEAAFPDYVGRVDFVFAFCELEKPYATAPITLNGEFARLGEARWVRGRDLWAAALQNDDWGGYVGRSLEPPPWALADDLGEP